MNSQETRACPTCRGAGEVAIRRCVDCGREVSDSPNGGRPRARCDLCGQLRMSGNERLRQQIGPAGIPFADCCTGIRRESVRIIFDFGEES